MKKATKESIGYWLGAGLIFALFVAALVLWRNRDNPGESPDILILGDSLFADERGETSVANLLEQKLGVTVMDASFGGTAASYLDRDARLGHTMDAFGLAALARALSAGDFRVQRNARLNMTATEYFEERLALLEEVDLTGVDTVLIDHCLNDYQAGVIIEDPLNPSSEYTYKGALRYAVTTLRDKDPDLRIILVSPTAAFYANYGGSGAEVDLGGGTLDAYMEAQRAVAEETGAEWIDLYHDLYGDIDLENRLLVTVDGVHPNEEGRERISEALAEYLRGQERE